MLSVVLSISCESVFVYKKFFITPYLQLQNLQQMGNSRARAVYEANLPDNFRRPQTDSALEAFIRSKYEHKKYIAKEWVQPPLPKVNTSRIIITILFLILVLSM